MLKLVQQCMQPVLLAWVADKLAALGMVA